MPETVYLLDVFNLTFQVFHAIPPMTSPTGQPTNAVFGICRDLVRLLKDHRPDWLICAADSPGPDQRSQLYPEYKAHRAEMPEDLRPQLPLLWELFEAFGLPVVGAPGWEADDVIATLTHQAVARGAEVRILTSDKDARQLLSPQVRMYNLRKDLLLDEAALLEDWGVRPDQVVDFQSLVGDAVDNVPGVPQIGPKKAAALLQQFGTLDAVLSRTAEVTAKKLRENLETYADQARLSRELVRLRTDLDLGFNWDQYRQPQPKVDELQELFRRLGFGRLINDVQQFAPKGSGDVPLDAGQPASSTAAKSKKSGRSLFDEPSNPGPDATTDSATPRLEQGGLLSDEASTATDSSAGWPRVNHRWQIVDTPTAFEDFVARFSRQTEYCLDLETTDLQAHSADIVGWAFCFDDPADGELTYYLPVRGPAGSTLLDPQVVVDTLKPLLEDPKRTLSNQNAKYDWMVLFRVGIRVPHLGVDPMIADYLLDAGARGHNLDLLIAKHLQCTAIPISELIGTGKNQKRMDEIPVAQVAEYATEDAACAWRLAKRLRPQLEARGLWELYWNLERPLIPILAQMEYAGITVDATELGRQSADVATKLAALVEEIHTLAGHPFNIDSPIQLRKVLFEEQQLPVQRRTKTGPSTDQDVLEELAALHPLPAKIIDHRQLSKLQGTYLDALPKLIHPATGRVHCSFNQVVAATGRLSCSDPNLQNIPIRTAAGRQIRRAFLPADPSWSLVSADYSQIELRMLAHYSGDPVLRGAFARGEDIHTAVASDVYQVDPRDVTIDMRRVAKAVNFGVIYGQTAFGLAAALGIPRGDAAAFIEQYFERYAGVASFLEEVLDQCAAEGEVRTILGRVRKIDAVRSRADRERDPQRRRNMPERTAINTVIQGSAADLIKQAMIRLDERLRRDQSPSRMLLQIHDELVFETPAAAVRETAQLLEEEMTHAMELSVPLVVDVVAGPNWLDGGDIT